MRTTTRTLLLATIGLAGCRQLESPVGNFDPNVLDELLSSPVVSDLDSPPAHPWRYADEVLNVEPQESGAPVPPRIGGDERVNLELRGVPLGEALHLIAERAGVNVLLDSGLGQPVSASFPSVRLDDALQILLAQNGLALVEEPAGIFWVRRDDGSARTLATFSLRSVGAADVVDNLVTLLGEDTVVVADTNQNVILVNGSEADAALAAKYLEQADRLKPQVLLEVRIFEASLSDDFEFGLAHRFDFRVDDNTWNVLSALSTPGSNFTATFTTRNGEVQSTINALRNHIGLELVSAPRVMAVTNTEAVVEVIEEVPYIQTTSSVDTGASTSSFTEVSFKEAGIKLTVTPTIQEAGILQVVIDQELSEVVGFFLDIPIVDKRHFSTQFLVADRQTIVLGGLMQSAQRDVDNGTPFLRKVPILGRLFRSDQDSSSRRELLVFVTPRILDPNQAAQIANDFQSEFHQRSRRMSQELDQPQGADAGAGEEE